MNVHSAASVFHVKNLRSSLKFYTEVLGFEEDFEYGEYAGVKRGNALIHLAEHSTNAMPVGSGHIYIFCDEVDPYYDNIKGKGAETKRAPQDAPYGMRDFEIVDIDGNSLAFGCESKKA